MIGSQTTQPYYPFWPYYGYFDLGPVQIPPMPAGFGLTDRTTGQVLYPAIDPAQNNRLVLLTSPPVAAGIFVVYPKNNGPYFGSQGYKLIADNNHLVFIDQQPDSGPMPLIPVLGNAQYGAVLTIVNVRPTPINGKPPAFNPKFPSIKAPSGVQDGYDNIDFYFASFKGPINRCADPRVGNCGSNTPCS